MFLKILIICLAYLFIFSMHFRPFRTPTKFNSKNKTYNLHILTANVRGINTPEKILNLKNNIITNEKIVFLQETKIDDLQNFNFFRSHFKNFFCLWAPSLGDMGLSAGLIIMIKKQNFIEIKFPSVIITDRYISVDIKIGSNFYRLINIYCHNNVAKRKQLLNEIDYLLHTNYNIILG